jgi:hypothetical protein
MRVSPAAVLAFMQDVGRKVESRTLSSFKVIHDERGGCMSPIFCIVLVTCAGALGGAINAFLSDNGFTFPQIRHGVWCPGALANVIIGAVSALASWALYGSGATIDLGTMSSRAEISLQLSAVVGALLVGVSGSRWLTNEVDKKILTKSVTIAGRKDLTPAQCEELSQAPPQQILDAVATV